MTFPRNHQMFMGKCCGLVQKENRRLCRKKPRVCGCKDVPEALSGREYETLDGGARLYAVPPSVMEAVMAEWHCSVLKASPTDTDTRSFSPKPGSSITPAAPSASASAAAPAISHVVMCGVRFFCFSSKKFSLTGTIPIFLRLTKRTTEQAKAG